MNKVVLITGASRGIGAACATIFAKNGYNIIINYLNSEKKAISLKNDLEKNYNVNCDIYKCDISKEEEVLKMYDFVKSKYNHIDVLINNAAICYGGSIAEIPFDKVRENFEVNVFSSFFESVSSPFIVILSNGILTV